MIRTQIQLPDALHEQAKRLAEEQEVSLTELVRRGLEHVVRLYGGGQAPGPEWRLPEPLALGAFLAPVEDWRDLASAGASATDPESD
jgi:hypothetical protein